MGKTFPAFQAPPPTGETHRTTKLANGLGCEYQTMPKWSMESIILLAYACRQAAEWNAMERSCLKRLESLMRGSGLRVAECGMAETEQGGEVERF